MEVYVNMVLGGVFGLATALVIITLYQSTDVYIKSRKRRF